jgi:ABC-type arginine transport system permease subunit
LWFSARTACGVRGILKASTSRNHKERIMGKYFLAWIMGVPAIVLVLLYFFFH